MKKVRNICFIIVIVILVLFSSYAFRFIAFSQPSITPSPQFVQHVDTGRRYYKTKSLVICGLMRDCESNIKCIRNKIERWSPYFSKIHVVIVENDSKDNTRPALFEWKTEVEMQDLYSVDILGCGINNPEVPCRLPFPKTKETTTLFGLMPCTDISKGRLEKMVYLRNLYLSYIRNHQQLRNFDLCCVMDMDLMGNIPLAGLLHSGSIFANYPKVDAVCSNGWMKSQFSYYYYYDTFAYQKNNYFYAPMINSSVSNQFKGKPFTVKSAFGGCVFYRVSSIQGTEYKTKEATVGYQCEHLEFHYPLKIMFDPNFLFVIES